MDNDGCLTWMLITGLVILVMACGCFEKKDVSVVCPDGSVMTYVVRSLDIGSENWGQTTTILLPDGGRLSVPTESVTIKTHKE